MTHRIRRFGNASRVLLAGMLLLLISVPALLIGAWRVSSVKADDGGTLRRQPLIVNRPAEPPPAVRASDPPDASVQYRPMTETEYREETIVVNVPEVDPKTGETVARLREHVVKYPVTTQRWEKVYTNVTESPHDQEIMQLVGELQEMKEDDESRDAKLNELRTRLELEFSKLHKDQSAEIERTERRLEALRKVHQQRGENKDKIVQRRIDELLGKADPLSWNTAPLISPSVPPINNLGQVPTRLGSPYDQTLQYDQKSRRPIPLPRGTPSAGQNDADPTRSVPSPPRTTFPQIYGSQPGQPPQYQSGSTAPIPLTPGPRIPTTQYGYAPATPGYAEPAAPREPAASKVPGTDYYQSQPPLAAAQVRVGVPRSALGEVFDLARRKSNANAELLKAEHEFLRSKELRAKAAISFLEFKTAESEYAKRQREVKLIDMQLQAFSEAMRRVEDLAKSTLQRALSNLKTITAATQSGLKTEQELVDAEYEVEKSRIALADASENIRKLRETMQAVEDFAKQAAGEETADPAQPVEAEPVEPVKPEQPGQAPKER